MKRKSAIRRSGKILVLLAVTAPVLIGVVGLVIDAGVLASQKRRLQQAVDAAATAAATTLRLGGSTATAVSTAIDFVTVKNGLTDAIVKVHAPPVTGPHSGVAGFVEVDADLDEQIGFIHVLDGINRRGVHARAVAGSADATSGAAIVVLDPNPAAFSAASATSILALVNPTTIVSQLPLSGPLSSLGLGSLLNTTRTSVVNLLTPMLNNALGQLTLPALPTLTAGLEVEGAGRLMVDGAIHVNTEWGGFDENGSVVGSGAPFPYAVACTPILPTTRVKAADLRVVGGVDDPDAYLPFSIDDPPPLHANRLPVPDPYESLAVPSTAADPANVSASVQGGHRIAVNVLSVQTVMQPLLGVLWPALKSTVESLMGPSLVAGPLQPGVYDSITVLSLGEVEFQPGVYIIRGKSPITQMSLSIIGGWIKADGVLFYITDSTGYNAATGSPDANEASTSHPTNTLIAALPSALIAPLLPGSHIAGLNAPASSFDGMLIYQRRNDRRPIVLAATQLVGGGQISGAVYSKWGHVAFIGGSGSYDLRFVCGTMRVLTVFDTTLAPSRLLPAARDVFLVE